MLCYFLRPNKQRIKKWVPMYSRHVEFDRGKYGIERYRILPQCIILEWYNAGINKFFPVLIPTLDFRWDTPNPKDPTTGETYSWHSPEVEAAGYSGQSYVGFTKAAMAQTGIKRNKLIEMIPLITLGLLIIGGVILYQFLAGMSGQIEAIQQLQGLRGGGN